jgi:hypothetical protein
MISQNFIGKTPEEPEWQGLRNELERECRFHDNYRHFPYHSRVMRNPFHQPRIKPEDDISLDFSLDGRSLAATCIQKTAVRFVEGVLSDHRGCNAGAGRAQW